MPKKSAKEPWEKPAPKKSSHTKLTPEKKVKAKARAKRAGRPYPNLVDNMAVAKEQKSSSSKKSSSAKKPAAKKSTGTKKSTRAAKAKSSGTKSKPAAKSKRSGAKKS